MPKSMDASGAAVGPTRGAAATGRRGPLSRRCLPYLLLLPAVEIGRAHV